MVDQISADVCGALNQVDPGWTWAAQMNNQRNWSRIYRLNWVQVVQAGTLQEAVRGGEPIVQKPYPLIWFEFRCTQRNHPNGPFELCVPVSTKGFRRSCRCAVYDAFLHGLIQASQDYWPELHHACTQYVNNLDEEYIAAHLIPIDQPYAANVHAFIGQHANIINIAFGQMH